MADLKDKLVSKLSDLNGLVSELGELPGKTARRSSVRRMPGISQSVKSPEQRDWKNRQTIGGVIAGERELQEGRLPPIAEDRCYPRRTLETQDLQNLVANGGDFSESPDLGPPPVAHFDVPDPIKFDPRPAEQENNNAAEAENEPVMNMINLETRRKRRASTFLDNMSSIQPESAPSQPAEGDATSKAGAKRKLDTRDDSDVSKSAKPEDFAFQRKSVAAGTPFQRPRGSRFTRPEARRAETKSQEAQARSPQGEPLRKALAPKKVNSPSKPRRVLSVNDKIAALKEDVAKQANARVSRQDRRQSIAPVMIIPEPGEPDRGSKEEESGSAELPPKTPASLDPFSPTSTEPSVKTNAQPTEMAVTASVEDVLGNAGRGSRRVRSAVSYAEPNLRDKMRRPGKELVGAVEGIDRTRETSQRAESVDPIHTGEKMKIETQVKDNAWKNLPQANEEPPSPLKDKLPRLSDEVRKSSHELASSLPREADLDTAVSKLSIYDGPASSPHDDVEDIDPAETEAARRKGVPKSRRHSSNPANLSRLGQESALVDRFARPTSAPSHRNDGSRPASAAATRPDVPRPNSAADLRRSAGTASKENQGPPSATDLRRSNSVTSLIEGRGSRRKSMMA